MENKTLEEIRDSNTQDLIDGLRGQKFSLLKSMGFKKLRAEMVLTGLVCRTIVFLTGLTRAVRKAGDAGVKSSAKAFAKTRKLLQIVAPVDCYGTFPHHTCGMVVGFNHPSLGEILRCIYICMTQYRFHQNLFPVNLPWYEALMPIAKELEAIGIYIMPIITPSTRGKMAKVADAETLAVVDELSHAFNMRYLDKCTEFIKANENIWVAPSATRQHYVFKTPGTLSGDEKIEPQTMTLLATSLIRAGVKDCVFLPLCIVPPHGFGRGLNLFKTYRVGIGQELTMDDARENVRKRCEKNSGRKFEYEFLMKIAHALIKHNGSKFICPPA